MSRVPENVEKVISLIKEEVREFEDPAATKLSDEDRDPFKVLISCIISIRTKDTVTTPATERLFDLADNPENMLELSEEEIAEAIYPSAFYSQKAGWIRKTCSLILEEHDGEVPESLEELKEFPGIGNKCGAITLVYGFRNDNFIPVDTHVHRISNRLGWVDTKTPDQTMEALMEKIPEKHWMDLNDILVKHGQNVCKPQSPFCSECPVEEYCEQRGVDKHR